MTEPKPGKERPEDTIAAFDRELAKVRELTRRHVEQVRNSHANDRPARDSDHHRTKG